MKHAPAMSSEFVSELGSTGARGCPADTGQACRCCREAVVGGSPVVVTQLSLSETLVHECMDAKLEMLGIIEQELQLKLDIREIKKDFLKLLQDFEKCEALDKKYSAILGKKMEPRYKKFPSKIRKAPPAISEPQNKSTFKDSPLKKKQTGSAKKIKKPKGERLFFESIRARDRNARQQQVKAAKIEKSLSDLSSITKFSDTSQADSLSDSAAQGPLHSTQLSFKNDSRSASDGMLSSTEPSASDMSDSGLDEYGAPLGKRQRPQGLDNLHLKPLHQPKPALSPLALHKHLLTTDWYGFSDASDSTPTLIQRSRHLMDFRSPLNDSSPASTMTLVDGGSAQSTRYMSRERYLVISDDGSRDGSHKDHPLPTYNLSSSSSFDASSSASTKEPHHQGTAISCRDITGMSMDATRDSLAHASHLTSPPSSGIPSAETTPSSLQFSPFTSCQESSYKESDGQGSPLLAPNNTAADLDSSEAPPIRIHPPIIRMTSGCTSGGSLSSCPDLVPVNSPNTSNSVSGSDLSNIHPIQQDTAIDAAAAQYIHVKSKYTRRNQRRGFHSFRSLDDDAEECRPPVMGQECPLTVDLSAQDLDWLNSSDSDQDIGSAFEYASRSPRPKPHYFQPCESPHGKPEEEAEAKTSGKKKGAKKLSLLRRIQSFGKQLNTGARK